MVNIANLVILVKSVMASMIFPLFLFTARCAIFLQIIGKGDCSDIKIVRSIPMKDKRRVILWFIIILGILLGLFLFQYAIFNAWLTAYYTDPATIKYHGRWSNVFIMLSGLSFLSVGVAIYKLRKNHKPPLKEGNEAKEIEMGTGDCPPMISSVTP